MSSPRINKYIILFNILILLGTIFIAKIYVDHSIDIIYEQTRDELYAFKNATDNVLNHLYKKIETVTDKICIDDICVMGSSTIYKMNCTFINDSIPSWYSLSTLKCTSFNIGFETKINYGKLDTGITITPYGKLSTVNNYNSDIHSTGLSSSRIGSELSFGGIIKNETDYWYVSFDIITETLSVRNIN
jgi:hypothetical protein